MTRFITSVLLYKVGTCDLEGYKGAAGIVEFSSLRATSSKYKQHQQLSQQQLSSNIQFKLTALVCLMISSLAAATPLVARGGSGGSSRCNTGPVQCCNSVQSADSEAAAGLLALLGVVVQDVTVPVGITCSPISVIGIGGNSCSAQPVCCENNNFNGVVAIGCTPINVNL